nr:hypothetical protein [Phyllobacterium myrsinacearum]
MTIIATIFHALVTVFAITQFTHGASAQTAIASSTPLAVGLTNGGIAEAQVIEAVRKDEILTVKLRFKPVVPDKLERIYDSISKTDYENSFYILAGNKKHLLLTDSNDKPLTDPFLVIKTAKGSPIAGSWHGRFPAPPKDVSEVSLTIPGVETLDAIKITDR